jgi:hypothetical protein
LFSVLPILFDARTIYPVKPVCFVCTTSPLCCLHSLSCLLLSSLLSVQPITVCCYHLCCLYSLSLFAVIIFAVCTAYHCLLSVQPILFVVCTAHAFCCLYRLSSLLFVQPILFAVCTTNLHMSTSLVCCQYIPSSLLSVHCTAYLVCFLYSLSYLIFVQPFPFVVCTAYPLCCLYSLSCLLFVQLTLFCNIYNKSCLLSVQPIIFAVCTTCLVCCLHTAYPVYALRTNPFAVHVCTLYSPSCSLFTQATLFLLFFVCTASPRGCCPYSPFRLLHMNVQHILFLVVQRILFSGSTAYPVWYTCMYSTSCLPFVQPYPVMFTVCTAYLDCCLYSLILFLLSVQPIFAEQNPCISY